MTPARRVAPTEVPGLAARRIAADILDNVLRRHRPLDAELDGAEAHPGLAALADRDRALVRKLVATVLRRLGTLRHLLRQFLDRGFPKDAPRVETVLLVGAAQILFLDVPDHAAVDLSVRLVQADRRAAQYPGLINAVLRRVAREGPALLAELDPAPLDTPPWLFRAGSRTTERRPRARSRSRTGTSRRSISPSRRMPRAGRSGCAGACCPPAACALSRKARSRCCPATHEGAWWVQDAAAALPVRLLGDIAGKRVADLCAAPGGKTAQLAEAGAQVTAVDRSAEPPGARAREPRPARPRRRDDRDRRDRMAGRTVRCRAGGCALLVDRDDPPPSRRRLAEAAKPTSRSSPGCSNACSTAPSRSRGPAARIVYCVCSLEPEEGEQQIEALLAREPASAPRSDARRRDRRNRRIHQRRRATYARCRVIGNDSDPRMSGLDGFFAARLERLTTSPIGPDCASATCAIRWPIPCGDPVRRRRRAFAERGRGSASEGWRVPIADRDQVGRLRGAARVAARAWAGSTRIRCCAGASRPPMADRLLIAPQDLRTADPTRASEIYAGRFAFAGKIVICDGRSPFEIEPPSEEWAEQLLGFGWLRHLRAAESSITRANARALVDEWIALQGPRHASTPGGPTWWRAASSRGSARRRWCCTTPTCSSTAASCAI